MMRLSSTAVLVCFQIGSQLRSAVSRFEVTSGNLPSPGSCGPSIPGMLSEDGESCCSLRYASKSAALQASAALQSWISRNDHSNTHRAKNLFQSLKTIIILITRQYSCSGSLVYSEGVQRCTIHLAAFPCASRSVYSTQIITAQSALKLIVTAASDSTGRLWLLCLQAALAAKADEILLRVSHVLSDTVVFADSSVQFRPQISQRQTVTRVAGTFTASPT
ncbi:hypothetical protein JKP88DRAFT_256236 [Tribonema minus]|uniref:Uncharacterized protein n=1 Tax=Tribonema minus TaxID=303371 RepID=A0A835YQY1_9STRA|nr:hypothetical protein JKP88DRAFT_256236 [Tribonema minus]